MPGKRTGLTKKDYETLAALRYALRIFLRFSEEQARAASLTPQQHQALLAIKGFPGRDRVSVGELAERLQMKHHSVVELADRLAAARLVQREQGTRDRRKVFLALTAHGDSVLERLSVSHKQQIRRLGPEIGRLLKALRSKASVTK